MGRKAYEMAKIAVCDTWLTSIRSNIFFFFTNNKGKFGTSESNTIRIVFFFLILLCFHHTQYWKNNSMSLVTGPVLAPSTTNGNGAWKSHSKCSMFTALAEMLFFRPRPGTLIRLPLTSGIYCAHCPSFLSYVPPMLPWIHMFIMAFVSPFGSVLFFY